MMPDPPRDTATEPGATDLAAPAPPRPARRRRWSSLNVRSMMLLILVVGGGLGWQVRRASLQRRAVAAIRAVEGEVHYLHQTAGGTKLYYPSNDPPPGPALLRRWIGDDYFQEVAMVELPDEHPLTAADLAVLADCPGLRRLEVGCVRNVGDGFRHLAGLRSIREVQVNGPGLDDAMLAAIGELPTLEKLAIRDGTELTDAGLRALRPLTRLVHLWINEAPKVTGNGLAPLIERNPGLTRVDLEDTGADDRTLAAVGRLPSLEILDLDRTRISDRGLAELARARTLIFLDLNETAIGDAGLAHLAGLREMVGLELAKTRITAAGMRHLARLPLTELRLEGSTVDDAGLRALRPLAGTLSSLYLNDTRVTDAGIAHLAGFEDLSWLELERTRVTDASVPTLVAFPKLRLLELKGTATTAGGHAKVQGAHPEMLLIVEEALDPPGP